MALGNSIQDEKHDQIIIIYKQFVAHQQDLTPGMHLDSGGIFISETKLKLHQIIGYK